MEATFKVRKNDGTQFTVRLLPISIKDSYKKLGVDGGWDKSAEIEIDGVYYGCRASQAIQNGKSVQTVKISSFSKDIQEALNIPISMRKSDIHIVATNDWHSLYLSMLEAAEEQFKIDADQAIFSKITFVYHTTHKYFAFRWDSDLDSDYIFYNTKIRNLQDVLKYVDHNVLSQYETGLDEGDHSLQYSYEVPVSDIDKIINMSLPGLEEAAKKKEKAETYKIEQAKKQANIEAGCIYFHCESAPHDEDMSKVILTRPAPSAGAFTPQHRISDTLFARVKKFSRYYSAEFLEDCDMFTSSPGWRFSKDAIEELMKTNRVFIDDIEVTKE